MKSITGKTRVCGVIGDPIDHTLSPLIHNHIAESNGEEMVYVPFHVQKEQLKEAIAGAYALNLRGLNVTMPHKQKVMSYVSCLDETATRAHAVNTLVYTPDGYKGYNTDVAGLRRAMEKQGICWQDKDVAIIGSGGASYAAVVCVADQAKSIMLYNRTSENAQALKLHMEQFYHVPITVHGMDDKPPTSPQLVIQTTGVGMGTLEGQMPQCSKQLLQHAQYAVDLIYNPQETAFLAYAKQQGCQVMNGFDMLYYQAVEAYEKMHQCELTQTVSEAIREQIVKELHK